jgi:hypothetical protein
LAHPLNWRVHDKEQQRALAGALSEVGLVATIMIDRRTSMWSMATLRVELAIARSEPSVTTGSGASRSTWRAFEFDARRTWQCGLGHIHNE